MYQSATAVAHPSSQKLTSGPWSHGPADFEFHSAFCTVRNILYSTMFFNALPDRLIAPI